MYYVLFAIMCISTSCEKGNCAAGDCTSFVASFTVDTVYHSLSVCSWNMRSITNDTIICYLLIS